MKRFRTITALLIVIAAVILLCDGLCFVRLYRSIRTNMEHDIRAAMVETDVDEMWYRTTHQMLYNGGAAGSQGRSITGTLSRDNEFVTYEENAEGDSIELSRRKIDDAYGYTSQIMKDMSLSMHTQIDPYLPIRLDPVDSILAYRLSLRGIYPDFVAVEMTTASDSIVLENWRVAGRRDRYDRFELQFNSVSGNKYVAYLSPLTRLILQQMWGIMIFTAGLIVVFAFLFYYMHRFISRLRSIEEMKDSFVNSMTHELKTPIAVAYSAADSLLRYYDESTAEHNRKYLEIIIRELSKHSAMVENILSVSMQRMKTLKLQMQPVPVREMLDEICRNQSIRAGKDVKFSVVVEPGTLTVVADPMHFANVIKNLVENAIKYSGSSVKICIHASGQSLSVSDNGFGISQKYLPHVFDRFFRVPAEADRYDAGGYGIGLYYVKNICGLMGWSISVRSRQGEGTTFTINYVKHEDQDTAGGR